MDRRSTSKPSRFSSCSTITCASCSFPTVLGAATRRSKNENAASARSVISATSRSRSRRAPRSNGRMSSPNTFADLTPTERGALPGLDGSPRPRYITKKLNNRKVEYEEPHVHDRHARQDVRGTRRSHQARDPRAPGFRPGLRDGARRAVLDEPSRRVPAPQGAGGGGAGCPRPGGGVAAGRATGRGAPP